MCVCVHVRACVRACAGARAQAAGARAQAAGARAQARGRMGACVGTEALPADVMHEATDANGSARELAVALAGPVRESYGALRSVVTREHSPVLLIEKGPSLTTNP